MKVSKKSRKGAQAHTRKMARGSAVQAVPVPAYRFAQERGDLYSSDPGVRESAWQAAHGDVVTKSAAAGVSPDELALWESVARTDPDPGVREFFWSEILKATGAA